MLHKVEQLFFPAFLKVPGRFFQDLIRRPEPVICIDSGNSRAKACVFREGKVVEETQDFSPEMANVWRQEHNPFGVIVSNVGEPIEPIKKALSEDTRIMLVNSRHPVPFQNKYRSEGLGVDRIAGLCGALLHQEGQNSLVMDAGTCLTYDVLDWENTYHGGIISPGMEMRLKAMHTFTARLPLLEPEKDAPLAGLSTEECMMSGALNGIRLEAEGFCRKFAAEFSELQVLLTGGAAEAVKDVLPLPVTHRPLLVLEGLLLLFWWQHNQN